MERNQVGAGWLLSVKVLLTMATPVAYELDRVRKIQFDGGANLEFATFLV